MSPRSPSTKSAARYPHMVSRDPIPRKEGSIPSRVVKFMPYPKLAKPTPVELHWMSKSMGRSSHDDIKLKDAKMVSIYTYHLLQCTSYTLI